jgi:hypothetical protein
MILSEICIRKFLSDRLESQGSVSFRIGIAYLRDFAVYVSLSSRTSPRDHYVVGASFCPQRVMGRGFKRVRSNAFGIGPVAQLVRARA